MPTWMFRTKDAEAARQAAAREQRQDKGNCIRCGFQRDPKSKQLCTKHLLEQRAEARVRYQVKNPRLP